MVPDIYVFGLQESPSSPSPLELDTALTDDFLALLSKFGDYRQLASKTLWGIKVIVIVRSSLLPVISAPKTAVVRTGVGQVMGNKGGAAITFFIHETGFCFITSHLAARSCLECRRKITFRLR